MEYFTNQLVKKESTAWKGLWLVSSARASRRFTGHHAPFPASFKSQPAIAGFVHAFHGGPEGLPDSVLFKAVRAEAPTYQSCPDTGIFFEEFFWEL